MPDFVSLVSAADFINDEVERLLRSELNDPSGCSLAETENLGGPFLLGRAREVEGSEPS